MAKTTTLRIVWYIIIGIVILWSLFPILWTFLTSIKQPVDAFAFPPRWLFKPTFSAYQTLWVEREFTVYLKNSAICAVSTMIISVSIGALAAYAISRYRSWVSFMFLVLFLVLRMFPRPLLVIPYYTIAHKFGLRDNLFFLTLCMVAINQPFTIWLLRGFYTGIPVSLEEAALIDGCSRFKAFVRIIVPAMRPGIITASIFSLLLAYNEFMVPLVLTGTHARTLSVAISEYGAEHLKYWTLSAAGAISIAFPILLAALFAQRYLVKGLTFGAVKY